MAAVLPLVGLPERQEIQIVRAGLAGEGSGQGLAFAWGQKDGKAVGSLDLGGFF